MTDAAPKAITEARFRRTEATKPHRRASVGGSLFPLPARTGKVAAEGWKVPEHRDSGEVEVACLGRALRRSSSGLSAR